jgi:hypothetical protein
MSKGKGEPVSGQVASIECAQFRSGAARSELIGALLGLGVLNAEARLMGDTIAQHGLPVALANGLGVSWVVWLAVGLGFLSLRKAKHDPLKQRDLLVAVACALLFAWPTAYVSMVGVTILAIYTYATGSGDKYQRAAAIVMFAIAVNGVWTRLFMAVAANPILAFDARLVGWLTGVAVDGNVVGSPTEGLNFTVGTPCSFVSNASLALLLWLCLTRALRPLPIRREFIYALVIFAGVAVINTIRISIMIQDRASFAFMHDGLGAQFVSPVIMMFTLVVTGLGLRHELAR